MFFLLMSFAYLLAGASASPEATPLDPLAQHILERQAPSLLQEYRGPEARDLFGEWATSPEAYRVRADFRGDGAEDVAVILVRRNGPGFAVVVLLDPTGPVPTVKVLETQKWAAQGFGVAVVKPGRYRTAAGKGYSGSRGDPPEIILEHPAIDRFHFESWNAFWFWDQQRKRFRYMQMSD
jgi:hypothetical protein